MKRLSLLAIAAVAALALTAAIGSATASATLLCKSSVNPCPTAERLPAGSFNSYSNAGEGNTFNFTLASTGSVFRCKQIYFAEKTLAESGTSTWETGTYLEANGARGLWDCWHATELADNTCSMSMSESKDIMFAFSKSTTGFVETRPITISADCGGSNVCTWSGKFVLKTSGGQWSTVGTAEGSFSFKSGVSTSYCGSSKTLKTVPLTLVTESYLVGGV